ncbi:hypothetical protein [Bradyrhizobium sp. RDI18]|uniref:hypothetical protein n=1 Tax=Bradyrhizobium sp. RDI18 TaxID=3367400 RepID=UPI00371FB97A
MLTASAEALLQRMLDKIDRLCADRDRLCGAANAKRQGAGRTEVVSYFQDDPNPPPFHKALAEARQLATREGYCYQHVQAITVAIDQYAEKALGNRDYFLNKPYGMVVAGRITSPDCSRFLRTAQECPLSGGLFCELSYCQSVFRCRASLSPSLRR